MIYMTNNFIYEWRFAKVFTLARDVLVKLKEWFFKAIIDTRYEIFKQLFIANMDDEECVKDHVETMIDFIDELKSLGHNMNPNICINLIL